MNTGTIATRPAPDRPFESIIVIEPILNHPDEIWEPYGAELKAIFGFDPGSDPDPSEWFPLDEFYDFRPYLETVRKVREASLLAEEALGRCRAMAGDIVERDRASEDHDKASRERDAASAQQRRLDRVGLGEIRLRAEDRLGIRRHGLELPTDLRFV
jgi:hypothetical protein